MKGLEKSALSVSAVALFLSDLVKNQLGPVLIKGEISNLQLRKHSSYLRFSLKDAQAKINCLTHSSTNAAKLLAHLQDGDEILIFAQPSYYTKYGQVSFFTDEMMKLGEGIFYSQLEQLRLKLYEEGLFNNKKTLPKNPQHIGIITSADGAALQDILRVAQDRYPFVQISIFPSLVQGQLAVPSLVKALSSALTFSNLDAIIIGRGGGSSEDLDAFNAEELVRLVASSSIPIISAVGHETDTTLIDYVSDYSAPTPTGAAMTLLPDRLELLQELSQIKQQLLLELHYFYREEFLELDRLKTKLISDYQNHITQEQHQLQLLKTQLIHPEAILKKGFSLIETSDIQEGQEIIIKTKNTTIYATVQRITRNTNE
ncbi:MAG: exodeoxyribonuclease VII large subunit [Brevinema sp.]